MTTIAFRSGVLAADSRISCGPHRNPVVIPKIVVGTRHRAVYAFAGNCRNNQVIVRTLEAMAVAPWDGGPDLPDEVVVKGTTVLAFLPDGRVIEFSDAHAWLEMRPEEFMADGSGREYALGAMAMGATAREAIEAAARFDHNTGGPVQEVVLAEAFAMSAPAPRAARPRRVARRAAGGGLALQ